MRDGTGSIVFVDDDVDTAGLLRDAMTHRGFAATAVHSGEACLAVLATTPADIVVTDVQMPGMSGLELCEQLRQRYPDVLALVITGVGTLDIAIGAIRAGAYDFITKPVTAAALAIALDRAIEHVRLRRELADLRRGHPAGEPIRGASRAVAELNDLIRRVAEADATVLVHGESGTGKELVARALHERSSRRDQPFVAINCAAMPANLLESELFGHVRGAFTDARDAREGLFVLAGRGTLLLDEIAEMPLELQPKLLRVLQERTLRRVGADRELEFAARVIATTNRRLEHCVAEGRFREDLYYRINVVTIDVPPLRARDRDVLLLAQHFVHAIGARVGKPVRGISEPAARALLEYDWPGNIRELENCIERAVALCRLDELTIDDLPAKLRGGGKIVVATSEPQELITLDEIERRYVRRVLDAVNGNKSHAARILGIDRRSLYRRLEEPDEG